MKNCFLFSAMLLLWGCTEDNFVLPLQDDQFSQFELQETSLAQHAKGPVHLQKAEVFTFQPAGGFGGEGNVLNEGDVFPPGPNSYATLERGQNHLGFRVYTTGLPPGAYTVWWIIFNDPASCNEPNAAGGRCAGTEEVLDLFLPSTGVVWATGGIVRSDGVGYFSDRLMVGEQRDETVILGSDLSSPLQNTRGAEVHLAIKYHGPASSDRDVLYAQTHTLLGSCDGTGGANSYDLPPPFGPYQCFDPHGVVFKSKLEPI